MRKILFLICFISFCTNAQKQSQSVGFIENKGQIVDQFGNKNEKVNYLLLTPGLNVQLRKNGFSYDIYETKRIDLPKSKKSHISNFIIDASQQKDECSFRNSTHRIDIDFLNSNPGVQLIAEGKTTDFFNYYNVPTETNGILSVYKYEKIIYRELYPNIDVIFFIPDDKSKPVEYNFIVRPNGNISDIQLKFSGAKTQLIDNKIKINVRFGIMEETLPLSWIENNESKKEVSIKYSTLKPNIYGFESSHDLSGKKVIIDPVPVRLWGTYFGGLGSESSGSMNIDINNNVVISGTTGSSTNIATAGPNSSGYDTGGAFIAKFSPDGQKIWSSYYPFSTVKLRLDSQNNMYVFGKVLYHNPQIPSPGCHQPIKDMYNSGYLIKLNNSGAKEWGTYYGGNQNEELNNLTVDSNGNVYLVGGTNSTNGFSTPGAFLENDPYPNGTETAFIAKFDSNGTRLWGTYYGGDKADSFFDCAISSDNHLILTGTANSLINIATPGTFQPTATDGSGMIIKFDLNGNLVWGTYIASKSNTFRGNLKGSHIFISGRSSANGLGTPGTMSENIILPLPAGSILVGDRNNYIAKFNIDTQQYIWGTYFPDQIVGVDIDASENVFFSGYTGINTDITTPDGYMPTKGFYQKSYLIKLNPSGQKEWGTYYGGNFAEQLGTVKIDLNNDIYLYGNTNGSTTGIATTGAHQTTLGSNPDTYLVKFRDCNSATVMSSNSPICSGQTLNLSASGGTNYSWTGPNGFTSNLQNPTINNANSSHNGIYSCTITGTIGGCDGTNTMNVLIGDTVKPIPNLNPLPTITGDCTTVITTPTATDNCAGTITATTTDPLIYPLPGNYTINWTYSDGNGNTETQIQNITISAVALPTATSPQNFCIQQNATINDIIISGQNIQWYDAATAGNIVSSSSSLIDGTTYYASQTTNSCESDRIGIATTIYNTPAPTANTNQSFCSTQNASLNDIIITGSNLIWYADAAQSIVLPNTTLLQDTTTYYATQTLNGCESIGNVAVTIDLINTLNAVNYAEIICDDLNNGTEVIDLNAYTHFLISGTGNTFSFYTSQIGAENQDNSDSISSNYNLTAGTHTIHVRIDSTNSCHQIVTLTFELVQKPIIVIKDIMPICVGSSIVVDAGSGFDSYLWSTNETSQDILINQSGNYSVTVTENHGTTICSSTKNFTVVNSSIATISEVITTDWEYNSITVLLNSNSVGDYEYSLDGVIFQSSNFFDNLESGEYTVYVRDRNGCGTITEDVYLLTYPKYFTPNDDGIHDFWKIKSSELEPRLIIKLFNRYGKFLQFLGADGNGWDGTLNGFELPADDYWFVVIRENGKEHLGHFTLKR